MNIRIEKGSELPVSEQIRRQVTELVAGGLLEAGAKIPSVRQLAKDLELSKNTVGLAYELLLSDRIIETRHGSGTFISKDAATALGKNLGRRAEMQNPLSDSPPMPWEAYGFEADFMGLPVGPGSDEMIRFTQASPDPELFPFDRIKQVASNMLWYPKEFFFDVGHPQGYQPLVEHLEKTMALSGVPMEPGENDIILTGGFQRALSLVLDFLVSNGQKVAIEAPTYSGILNLLVSKRIRYAPVPVDDEGMDTEYLAGLLQRGEISAIVTVPTYHNPTGVTMSRARREHLLRLAVSHRVPIIEDDWGRMLSFDGARQGPLKALDPGGYVIHIGTFSKIFLPGLRIGWITCPARISRMLLRAKLGADSGDSFFLQALLYEFIRRGHFDKHRRRALREYRKRRDAMCSALKKQMPRGCSFRVPDGGFSIWLKLPEGLPSLPLLTLARAAGVDFVPSNFLMPDRRDVGAIRLSFSRNRPEEIQSGVERLAGVIKKCIEDSDLLEAGARSYEELYR